MERETFRLWVVSGATGGPVMNAYETSSGATKAAAGGSDWGENISRGYTEEMEHFCWAIREFADGYYRDDVDSYRRRGQPARKSARNRGNVCSPGPRKMASACGAASAGSDVT